MVEKKGIVKLMGLNYTIEYKKRKKNKAANTLCKRELELNALVSVVVPVWIQEVQGSYEGDVEVKQIITELSVSSESKPPLNYSHGILRRKGRI